MTKSIKEAAKEALRKLVEEQIPPTPENYATIYYKIINSEQKLPEFPLDERLKNIAKNFSLSISQMPEISEDTKKQIDSVVKNIENSKSDDNIIVAIEDLHVIFDLHKKHVLEILNNHNTTKEVFQLIIENLDKLTFEDQWLSKQIQEINEIVKSHPSNKKLSKIEVIFKNIIKKQGILKQELINSQGKLQNVLSEFMDNLSTFSKETGDYHAVIEESAKKISSANKIEDINKTLDLVLRETKNIEKKSKAKKEKLDTIKNDAEDAQKEIKRLKQELEKSTELIRTDPLTGALNRKGMEETLDKTSQIMKRTKKSMCVAVIDIDNFKIINDNFGHHIGDKALVHLTNVVKSTLRPQDHFARYGGEEFVVILSETELEHAINVMTRVQRELARNLFEPSTQEKMLITFSCGVSQINVGDDCEQAIIKADEAMYLAKRAGKNRVVAAQ